VSGAQVGGWTCTVADQGCDRLTKVSLVAGGRDVIVYTTVSGAVGALIPFVSMDDVEFMTTLEMVSSDSPPLALGLRTRAKMRVAGCWLLVAGCW
jgi:hypothetical protein